MEAVDGAGTDGGESQDSEEDMTLAEIRDKLRD